jgi:hypothetical protein
MVDYQLHMQRIELCSSRSVNLTQTPSELAPTGCVATFVLSGPSEEHQARITIEMQLPHPPPTNAADIGIYLIGRLRSQLLLTLQDNAGISSALDRGFQSIPQKSG